MLGVPTRMSEQPVFFTGNMFIMYRVKQRVVYDNHLNLQ